MERGFLNERSLTEWLDVSIHTIRMWRRHQFIPFYKVGKSVRFNFKEIEDWVASKKIPIRQ